MENEIQPALNNIKLIALPLIISKYEGFVAVDCKITFSISLQKTKIIASESSLSVYFVKHDNKYIIIFKPSA